MKKLSNILRIVITILLCIPTLLLECVFNILIFFSVIISITVMTILYPFCKNQIAILVNTRIYREFPITAKILNLYSK